MLSVVRFLRCVNAVHVGSTQPVELSRGKAVPSENIAATKREDMGGGAMMRTCLAVGNAVQSMQAYFAQW